MFSTRFAKISTGERSLPEPITEPFYTVTGPSSIQLVRKNSSRIWDLNIILPALARLVNTDQSTLSNLQVLFLRDGDDYRDDIVAVNKAFEFITKASHLEQFVVCRIIEQSQHFDFGLLSSFTAHPALTRLTFEGHHPQSDPILILAILKNCPPSLQYLTVQCLCQGSNWTEKAQKAAAIVREPDRSYDWKRFEFLRNLDNAVEGSRQVLKTIAAACSNIEHLCIEQGQRNPLPAADLIPLIQAYPRGLESLCFSMPLSNQDQVISTLLQISATTLERVHLEYGRYTASSSFDNIDHIVQGFPQLGELAMQCPCWHPTQPCRHSELKAYIKEQGKPYDYHNYHFFTWSESSPPPPSTYSDCLLSSTRSTKISTPNTSTPVDWSARNGLCSLRSTVGGPSTLKCRTTLTGLRGHPLIPLEGHIRSIRSGGTRLDLCLREGDYYHNDITAINRVFEFISKASRLQELLAHRITGHSHQHSDFVLSSFALHPALTTLILGGPMSRSSPIFALAILKNCPPSLRYLSVECLCDGDDEYEKALEAAAVIQESEQRYDWKRLESLKELAIACRSGGCESWVHIPLLKNSPHLKLLSVLNTAPVVCPGIERLSVAQGERDPLAAADLVRLIQAYPRGLKSFRIAMPLSDQDHVISALLQTSGTTLERVYLEYGEHTPPSTVNSINRFVPDFPQLDEMDMQCHCRHSRSCQHNELRAYVRDQGKPYHGLDAF
ncbi:hypothetical protein BGX29_009305 [Mortierella sp. GBA35]|nr:hypothetical protein BGX29_009305 [Mortierella sp. GBA35]